MKNKFLKLFVLLAFAMSLLVIPNVADAATYDIYTYTVRGNKITITDCNELASGAITIPSEINGKKVTSIGDDVFENCTSLTSITIPDSVTSIGSFAFYGCNNLKDVYISDIDAWCGIAFESSTSNPLCNGAKLYLDGNLVTEVVVPDSVTSIGYYAFDGCTSLTSITIPDSVTRIGYLAFGYCTSLTSITIPDSVTSIGSYAFLGCNNLKDVYISDIDAWCGIEFGYPENNPLCNGAKLYLDGNLVTEVVLSDSVTSIGDYAFAYCTSLTSITIPDSVIGIGEGAFYNCTSLTSITIPDSVTSIGYDVFYGTALYNDSSNWDNGILYIDKHLIECKTSYSGECVIKPGTLTIADDAFRGCTSLTSITIPDSVTSIGDYAFSHCTSLTSITIPDSVTTIGEEAFGWCTSLTSITIPDSVTSIGSWAFRYCESLTSITIPDSVTSIGSSAFHKCTSLASITIPDSVTSIEDYAFYECTSLTTITIPDSVTSIGSSAFYNCKSLESVYFTGNANTWNDLKKSVGSGNEKLLNAEIFYVKIPCVFLNADGSVFEKIMYEKGSTIVLPDKTPTKTATAQYSYIFAGWEGYVDGMTITGDVTFTPIFTETINKYTYRFENEDGTLISSGTEDYGFKIVVPSTTPTKASTAQYTYTFANWSGYTYGMTLTEDVTFRATYAAVVNQYTYTFLNADGNKFYSKTADYGTEINLPSDSPLKAEQYLFTGWKGYSSGMILTEDVTFEPQYTLKSYNIIVEGFSSPISVVYGNNFRISPAKKEPYTFAGYYTEHGGKGTKLTDSDGDSISGFNFVSDICAYPYFEDMDKNIISVEPDCAGAEPGDTNVAFNVKIAISDDVQNAIMYVKYPSSMELKNVTSPFDYVEIQSETKDGEFTVAEIAFIYSFVGDFIPTLEYLNMMNLYFDISKSALPGTATVEIANDSVLVGENDFSFDVIEGKTLQINPKLAQSISIVGNTQILDPTKYEAVVYPDYTTDKSITWSVDDETIATITSDGYLIPVKSGTVTVTAKSVSTPSVYATKTVYVTKKADISSITSDIGYWIDSFESSDYDYEIIADSNVTEITFTTTFTGGMLKINGSTAFSGRTKTIPLTDDVTTITFERTNVANCVDSIYTITVVKSDESMITEKISENKINVTFNKSKILPFEKAVLLAALYDETGKLLDIVPTEVAKEDKYAEIEIAQLNNCTKCKLMLWDAFSILKPLCEYETVERN